MPLIAVGGFQHETNTFAPSQATYADFEIGGGWPALTRGAAIADVLDGMNIPAHGFMKAAGAAGYRMAGLVWTSTSPSAHVTRDAFERIMADMTDHLKRAQPVDAVFLELHGAMVTEHFDDGEGETLARVRHIVGPRVPIVASLDLHANVSRRMMEIADGMIAYRTYPHVDMTDTGARAARYMDWLLKRGDKPAKHFVPFDFLIPINAQCTFMDPAKAIYDRLAAIEAETGVWLNFTPGFPLADFAECGAAVFGYGDDPKTTREAVERLAQAVRDAERDFVLDLLAPDEAVARAKARGEVGRPVVIADTQDNPGGGGNGDTTGVLEALLRGGAKGAAMALLIDPPSALQATKAGVGATVPFKLGGIYGYGRPIEAPFKVERLHDGNFTCTGPVYLGSRMRLGPMALLSRDGVQVVLASSKVQCSDQAMFRVVGIEPARQPIVVVKSSVHFRADFQPIAKEVLVTVAPGPVTADPAALPWKKLRKGIRLRPLGPAFNG